jgi:hypothetical protein
MIFQQRNDGMISARHIRVIRDLPISQLSDDEIVKAAMYRLEANCCAIMYQDEAGQSFFLTRYKNKRGKQFVNLMLLAWEGKFGKMRRIKQTDKI